VDDAVPARSYQMLPMVGLGGSAGSIAALQGFFSAVPADSGMVYVVVMHLAADHESALAQIIQRTTSMPVQQVLETVRAQADHVYVIPPGKSLAACGNALRIADLLMSRGQHVAIDLFFRSLADTYGPHGVAIVLSGADSDGAIGLRRIKERGGLTIAQDPEEAEHAAMPRSAIATGLVDWVLPVDQMARRLVEYRRMERQVELPAEEAGAEGPTAPGSPDEAALTEVLACLHAQTRHEFSSFDRRTLLRRIRRRLQLVGVVDLPSYLLRSRSDPVELGALRTDLLCPVTNFFRDADAFTALAAALPALFENKGRDDAIRVWVPACATGEEAYSIAMLLSEQARRSATAPKLQVFATDVFDEALRVGREGVYGAAIRADLSAERLERFFNPDPRGYRVRRELRELVLFAAHDVLMDAPFARVDLISCRNLLISLSPAARQQALEVFHFALRPDGLLLLSVAESADGGEGRFAAVDAKQRLYSKCVPQLAAAAAAPSLRPFGGRVPRGGAGSSLVRRVPALAPPGAAAWTPMREDRPSERRLMPRSELHFRLIERFAPPSVVVDAGNDIIHMSQRVGRFLRLGGGEPSRDLLSLANPMLRNELRTGLEKARLTQAAVESLRVPVHIEGQSTSVDISISPADEIAPGCHLVVLAENVADRTPVRLSEAAAANAQSLELHAEIARLKEHLCHTIEQHEASIEELKASNEELQAMNEELRSATEELESSREEAQSVNEELSTVNNELKAKVDEIRVSHSDLHNLMGSIAVATVFLDSNLRVTLYTPTAVTLFNLIPSDIGRPLADLAPRLRYPELQRDAAEVLKTLVPIEREGGDSGGHWFLARIQAYRTPDERIAGVVMTFTEISRQKQAEQSLLDARKHLDAQSRACEGMLSIVPDGVYTVDLQKRLLVANRGVEALFGLRGKDLIGKTLREAGCAPELLERFERDIDSAIRARSAVSGSHAGSRNGLGAIDYTFAPILAADGSVQSVIGWSRAMPAAKA
ncbi:MAG: chemotaxis protein CheB, partial [Rhizobacter sp.]